MEYVKKVKNLCLTGNLSENWRRFKQNYDIFEEAAGIKTQSENKRIASFLNIIGEEAVELFNNFDLSAKDRKCYAKIQNAFEVYCTTKKRIVCERFKFFSRRQDDTETLRSYLADLTKMAASCEFKDQEASLIRDQFVSGIIDKELQADLLLFEDDLNFDKIIELLELVHVAKQQLNLEQPDRATDDIPTEAATTDDIATKASSPKHLPKKNDNEAAANASKEEKPEMEHFVCKRCGYNHKYHDCPAFGKKCLKCYQLHHFAACCQIKTEDFYKNPCSKCQTKHQFRNCPAFGKKCLNCLQLHHFTVYCPCPKRT